MIYGWGLRRTETSKLDVVDFGRNPQARQFGRYGTLNVRYGKAKKGQPPRRRNVLSVMDWAVEAVTDYIENVRPRFGFPDQPALWITERGGRLQPGSINDRFEAYRDALELPKELTPHGLRHSYVTHLTGSGDGRQARLPLAPAQNHGRPRDVLHHRPPPRSPNAASPCPPARFTGSSSSDRSD